MGFNLHSGSPSFRLRAPSLPKTEGETSPSIFLEDLEPYRDIKDEEMEDNFCSLDQQVEAWLEEYELNKYGRDFMIFRGKMLCDCPPEVLKDDDHLIEHHQAYEKKRKDEIANRSVIKLCNAKRVRDIISYPPEVVEDDRRLTELFEAWMDEFEVSYESEGRKIDGFNIFKANVLRYHKLNTTQNMMYRLTRHSDKLPGMIFCR